MTAEKRRADPSATEDSTEEDSDGDRSHLTDVEDGAGCTEIWEHLSERRENGGDD
ncbi:hypothetical protein [Halorussus sp. AFM4]|uniref:hypothetical protein n=1 Tax=Halorussus sp. AFM4 TaxID=3421651 RepID=UPI003EBAFE0D